MAQSRTRRSSPSTKSARAANEKQVRLTPRQRSRLKAFLRSCREAQKSRKAAFERWKDEDQEFLEEVFDFRTRHQSAATPKEAFSARLEANYSVLECLEEWCSCPPDHHIQVRFDIYNQFVWWDGREVDFTEPKKRRAFWLLVVLYHHYRECLTNVGTDPILRRKTLVGILKPIFRHLDAPARAKRLLPKFIRGCVKSEHGLNGGFFLDLVRKPARKTSGPSSTPHRTGP